MEQRECHLYFARRVSSLSCADTFSALKMAADPASAARHQSQTRGKDLNCILAVRLSSRI
jgi:hypothetical protein